MNFFLLITYNDKIPLQNSQEKTIILNTERNSYSTKSNNYESSRPLRQKLANCFTK